MNAPGRADDDAVRTLIEALTLGRAELAQRVGVSPAALQSWAVGRRSPRPENARRLARVAARHSAHIEQAVRALERALEKAGR
ncbi:MAG: helix-turn-helix domain-containing protein [Gemmatimonadota bacterium]